MHQTWQCLIAKKINGIIRKTPFMRKTSFESTSDESATCSDNFFVDDMWPEKFASDLVCPTFFQMSFFIQIFLKSCK